MNDSKSRVNQPKVSKTAWNNNLRNYLTEMTGKLSRNRNLILLCLIATYAWGMVAHAYIFFNGFLSHDSLNEFNAEVFGNDWKIQLGRVFVPYYRNLVRGNLTLPWLIGLLALLYISIAVFIVVKIFSISSKIMTVLTSGILTVNITVIAQAATYINDFDCNMLALVFSITAVYLWEKYDKGFLYGMIFVCLSLGLYQSYISVTVTLVLFYLIICLLDGRKFQDVLKKGIKSIIMFIGGGVLYLIAIKVVCLATRVTLISGNYNSIDTILSMSLSDIVLTTVEGYTNTIHQIFTVTSTYPAAVVLVIHIIMIAFVGLIIICRISQKQIHVMEKILTLVLVALLPIGMNVVYTLTGGMSHDLMYYAVWLVYLFALLISWWTVEHFEMIGSTLKCVQQVVLSTLVFIILWGNVQTANTTYFKKDLEYEANLSLFTRIVYRMESCEGYVTGETPVVFVGRPNSLLDTMEGFEEIYQITGNSYMNRYTPGAAARTYYQAYFDYILMSTATMADSVTWNEMQTNDEVTEMPCYPNEDSIAIIDGILVVKLG